MKKSSKKELKAKLRTYLDEVSRGEKFIITDQGKEAAILVLVPSERCVIRSLIDAKKTKWNGGKPEGLRGIRIGGKLLSEITLKEKR